MPSAKLAFSPDPRRVLGRVGGSGCHCCPSVRACGDNVRRRLCAEHRLHQPSSLAEGLWWVLTIKSEQSPPERRGGGRSA